MEKKEYPRYNRLKVVLADKSKTNRWLAGELNVDETTVSKWVRNAQQPEIKTLFRISEILAVEVCELLEKRGAVEALTNDKTGGA